MENAIELVADMERAVIAWDKNTVIWKVNPKGIWLQWEEREESADDLSINIVNQFFIAARNASALIGQSTKLHALP